MKTELDADTIIFESVANDCSELLDSLLQSNHEVPQTVTPAKLTRTVKLRKLVKKTNKPAKVSSNAIPARNPTHIPANNVGLTHPADPLLLICDYCQYRTARKFQMIDHMRFTHMVKFSRLKEHKKFQYEYRRSRQTILNTRYVPDTSYKVVQKTILQRPTAIDPHA